MPTPGRTAAGAAETVGQIVHGMISAQPCSRCRMLTVWSWSRAAAVSAKWAMRLTCRGRPREAWNRASMAAGSNSGSLEYLRSFGLFGLWQLWQSSGPGGRVHFMIAEKSSDVKVKRVSRLAKSKARCCISHNFGGFYQIIPCIRPAVVRIKVAHGCPATIRIFILGRAVQAWQREPGGRPMPPAMEAKGARSTIRERGSRGQSLSPLRLSSK